MKVAFIPLILLVTYITGMQTEKVFTVSKKKLDTPKEYQRYFDLNLLPGVDSICGNLTANFTDIYPYYDSIETLNLQLQFFRNGNTVFISPTSRDSNAHGILRFLQKKKDNSYQVIYVRNFKYGCANGRR